MSYFKCKTKEEVSKEEFVLQRTQEALVPAAAV